VGFLHRYRADETATDNSDKLPSRREALRRLPLLGLGASTAVASIGACSDPRRASPPAPIGRLESGADGQETSISGGNLVARNPLHIDPTQAPYNVKMDRYTTTSASMSSKFEPTHLTVSGYTFSKADIGKVIKVVGAGSAGTNLKTTIIGWGADYAILDAPCLSTVSGTFCMFGTDNATALNYLFDDLSYTGRDRRLARIAVFPHGVAMYSGTLIFPGLGTVKGAAENWVSYDILYARFGGAENTGGTAFYQMWDQNMDCARVRGKHDWNGFLSGFAIVQDWENSAGNGLSFRNSTGDAVKIIDGGTIERVAAMGCANAGFEFAGGAITATFRDLYAFCNGYVNRKVFSADTMSGSAAITNVSSFAGLEVGDILCGPGVPVDSVIISVDAEAGTITTNQAATATAEGVLVQRAGSPGISYKVASGETVYFDSLSGDQNSGGLLRLVGPGGSPLGAGIVITNLKNEYGENVYWNGYNGPETALRPTDVPQGANALVLDNLPTSSVNIRGLVHWGTASSGVKSYDPPNSYGRDLGAAILSLNTGQAPTVTWEGLTVHLPNNSNQPAFAYRDSWAVENLPIVAEAAGRGTNRPLPKYVRSVADSNVTASAQDSVLIWTSISAPRTVALPAISAVPVGREYCLIDGSGRVSTANTITATPSDSDAIVGSASLGRANGQLSLISTGTAWFGIVTTGTSSESAGVKVAAPAKADAPGLVGNWAADTNYVYICVATDTWMRTALTTW
jgi:hypothetical protein